MRKRAPKASGRTLAQSRLDRDRYRKRFLFALAASDDQAFIRLVWATHAIQDDRVEAGARYITFPAQAATSDISAPAAVHPWKLETLINELLAQPKHSLRADGAVRRLDCSRFEALVFVTNLLTKLENAEDGFVLQRVSVLQEIHRLAQRQFEWQRGLVTGALLYRAAYLYGGQRVGDFFKERRGVTIANFMLACFCMYSIFQSMPALSREFDARQVGLDRETVRRVVEAVAVDHASSRLEAARLRSIRAHVAYKPSVLRTFPCIRFGERLYAPLPSLVMQRGTSGLFYDVVADEWAKNEVADRFEKYARELLASHFSTHKTLPPWKYRVAGNVQATPDILLAGEALKVVVECKARRLSYVARFSENPVRDASAAYDEIAKGAFQVWRFVAHHRAGWVESLPLDPSAVGLVLTLDTWVANTHVLQEDVLKRAHEMADRAGIGETDRIGIGFVHIDDLEATLAVCTEETFLKSAQSLASREFTGFQLISVHRQLFGEMTERRPYPFADRMQEVLPWWENFEEARS